MPTCKPKTRTVPEEEYEALLYKVLDAGLVVSAIPACTRFTMVDSDFQVTQNMAEARFIAWDSYMDCGLLQVDGAGDAIVLLRQDYDAE